MATSVELNFSTPQEAGATKLLIFEAAAATGPWSVIETVAAVGAYPNYITRYRTDVANNANDWFAVQWQDSHNAPLAPMFTPMKGGAASFVQTIAERVRQRDVSLDEDVVTQEAEGAIERFFSKNPYTVAVSDLAPSKTFQTLNGLTYLVLARAMLNRLVKQSNITSATIGMVSMRSGEVSAKLNDITQLIEYANQELGGSLSLVMVMEDVRIGSSVSSWQYDQSRLVLELGLM